MPSWILISENDTWLSAPGFMVRAIVAMKGVQLLSPLASRLTWMWGRNIMTSEISNRCSNSGSSRKFAVSTSTASAGSEVAAAFQADVVKGDIACGKHRDFGRARDHQIEAGHGADLRLHRLAQGIPVEKPGRRDQADQRHAEKRRNRHPEALYSLGHRQ